VEREDVGVGEAGDGLDLAQETVGPDGGGDLRVEDLEGDPAVVLQVLCRKTVAIPPRPSSRSTAYRSPRADCRRSRRSGIDTSYGTRR
jgi:hypothetical protein